MEPSLASAYTLQSDVPSGFELAGDESVVGVDSFVAALGETSLVLGLLVFELQRSTSLVALGLVELLRHQSGLHGDGLYRGKQLRGHRHLGATRAEIDARGVAELHVPRAARVPVELVTVGDVEHSAASSATKQAREQGLTASPRLRGACWPSIRVPSQPLLVALEMLAVDVALVVFPQQHGPLIHRQPVTIGLAGSTVDDLGLALGLPVGIRARVARVGQNGDDVAVRWLTPLQSDEALAIRGSREEEPFSAHVEMGLSSATQAIEEAEDDTNRLLDSAVWVELESGILVPYVTDGYRGSQLSSSRLGSRCVDQTLADQRQLELAHRPLETEQ